MPNYEFKCEGCGEVFSRLLSISDRNLPLTESCSVCNCKTINKTFSAPLLLSDCTITADKKTGGQWSQLMGKIKKGIPKRYHEKLDMSSARTGKRWMG